MTGNFHNSNWSIGTMPPFLSSTGGGRYGGCITYWLVMTGAIISLAFALLADVPHLDKHRFEEIMYRLFVLGLTHVFFSYTCWRNTSAGPMSILVAFIWLIVWNLIFSALVPKIFGESEMHYLRPEIYN